MQKSKKGDSVSKETWKNSILSEENQLSSHVTTTANEDETYPPFLLKKFKKHLLEGFDRRFALILLGSFIAHVFVVWYFSSRVSQKPAPEVISEIQKNYAHLLLDKKPIEADLTEPSLEEEVTPDMIISSAPTMKTKLEAKSSEPDIPMEEAFEAEPKPVETKLPTTEDFMVSHHTEAEAREKARESLSQQVTSVGLLGLITTDSKLSENLQDDEIVEMVDQSTENLTKVLAKLNKVKLPRYRYAQLIETALGDSVYTSLRELRGKKSNAGIDMDILIGAVVPLEQARSTITTKNVAREEIPTTSPELRRKKNNGTMRNPDEITRIVLAHNKAIQDCYKQELKRHPDLKGKLAVRFTITPQGTVKEVSLLSSTLNNERMERCIINRIRRWSDFGRCDPLIGDTTYRQVYVFGY